MTNRITDEHIAVKKTDINSSQLDRLYAGRRACWGDFHAHSNSGGTSDGYATLPMWKESLKEMKTDFVAIVDHRQMRHMFSEDWDDAIFICGTEPGTYIDGSKAKRNDMHYNMIFRDKTDLAKVLEQFPEFAYTGGIDGYFDYPHFTQERMGELAKYVRSLGGIFTHNHPSQIMQSDDPLDYYFAEYQNIEIIYVSPDYKETAPNYDIWTGIIAAGKKVYAIAGGDEHGVPRNTAITTLYSAEKCGRAYVELAHQGDMTCGGVGIQMCIGDVRMGGTVTEHDDEKYGYLTVRVGDMFAPLHDTCARYRLEIYSDKGLVYEEEFIGADTVYAQIRVQKRAFYRAEVIDCSNDLRIAIGNPIWTV